MLMGASSANVSPPFHAQALWLAMSISGFIGSSARASWKMSSPPMRTARPRQTAQTRRPAAEDMTRGLGIMLLLASEFLVLRFQQTVVEAHIEQGPVLEQKKQA